MINKNYETPLVETVELQVETPVLLTSAEDSIPDHGE